MDLFGFSCGVDTKSLGAVQILYNTYGGIAGDTVMEVQCQVFSLPQGFSVRRARFSHLSGLLVSFFTVDSHKIRVHRNHFNSGSSNS